jgi:hypothetical protein
MDTSNRKETFKVEEIASWSKDKKIILPNVQRGFVWKPHQIENLWDSLLRRYPIGAMIFSENPNGKVDLLDGQQRASAICVGFDQLTFSQIKKNKELSHRLFIDIGWDNVSKSESNNSNEDDSENTSDSDNRKYLFRVITKSHPWGYKKDDNTKTVDSNKKREALKLFNVPTTDYWELNLMKCFPIDAEIAIPYVFFLESKSVKEVKEKIEKYLKSIKHEKIGELTTHIENISKIFKQTKVMLANQKIPALYLELDEDNEKVTSNKNSQDSEVKSEIENLFIRLNRGGTQLDGEELNYSILKSHIDDKMIQMIEKSGADFIKPAKLVTLLYLLFKHKDFKTEQSTDAIGLRIKPRDFQKFMKNQKELTEFSEFLKEVLNSKKYDSQTIIEYSKSLLIYDSEKNPDGLPFTLVSKITNSATELLFILVFRIYNDEKSKYIGERFKLKSKEHRTMLGFLTLLLWFGKPDKKKDYKHIFPAIRPCLKLSTQVFWSSFTIQRLKKLEAIKTVPSIDDFDKLNIDNASAFNKTFWDFIESKNPEYADSIWDNIHNKDFLLYAQRDFVGSYYKDYKQFYLDDTDTPYDWDHILPRNLLNQKKLKSSLKGIIREIYSNSNGNYRAWPSTLNRKDQDNSPETKFNGIAEDKDLELMFKKSNPNIKPTNERIKALIIRHSFCDESFVDNSIETYKLLVGNKITNENKKKLFNLILDRNKDIYNEWFKILNIKSLSGDSRIGQQVILKELISSSNMKKMASEEASNTFGNVIDENNWDLEYSNDLFHSNKTNHGITFYLILPQASNKEFNVLDKDIVEFGFYFSKTKREEIEKDINADIIPFGDDNKEMFGTLSYFTISTSHKESMRLLFQDFKNWLVKIADNNDSQLVNSFIDTLPPSTQKWIKS